MPVNDLISIADYNAIRNIINSVIGIGSGNFGYGQTSLSAADVTVNDRVTKTQWDNLRFDIINAIAHQTGTPPSITESTIGDLIRYDANLPNFQYLTLANEASTNRFNIGSGRFATEPSYNLDAFVSFYGEAVITISATWATANEARSFFNSGGRINFSSSFVPFKGTNQNNNWQTLLSSAGTKYFDGNTGINFYSLTTTDQKFDEQRGTGTYTGNYWRLFAKCNVANNSAGTANQIIFTIRWLDGYSENSSTENNQEPREGVSGNLSLTVTQRRAFAALYPDLITGSFQAPRPIWSSSGVAVTNPGERPLGPALAPDPGAMNSFVYPSRITSYILSGNLPKTTTGFFTVEHENTGSTSTIFTISVNTAPAGSVIVTNPSIGTSFTLAPNTSQNVTYTITSPAGSYPDDEFIYILEVEDPNSSTYNAKHTHVQIRVTSEDQIPDSYYLA